MPMTVSIPNRKPLNQKITDFGAGFIAFTLAYTAQGLMLISPIHEAGHYWAAVLRGQEIQEVGLNYVKWAPDSNDPVILAAGPIGIFMVGIFAAWLLLHRNRKLYQWAWIDAPLKRNEEVFMRGFGRKVLVIFLYMVVFILIHNGIWNLIPDKTIPGKDGTKIFGRK